MTVKNSGSLNSDINDLEVLTYREPQELWRHQVENVFRDIIDTYFNIAICNVYLIANELATTINTIDEYVSINGVYEVDANNTPNFSGSSDGSLTYLGTVPEHFIVFSAMHKDTEGGGTDKVAQRLHVNDSPISSSRAVADIKNTLGENSILTDLVRLEPNDVITVKIANLGSTSNIIVDTHHFIAHIIH
jgi:hypothetical protein